MSNKFDSIAVEKKTGILKQNLGYFRKSIPLVEGVDFFYVQSGKRKLYFYLDSGLKKLLRRKKYVTNNKNS